ncbi:hypothetical protein EGW08_015142, partial [Elysia chlorotica]
MSTIELELNEEEKAQLLASLTMGVSESSISTETPVNRLSVKNTKEAFIGPPRPVNRDGMGRYIPKPGGKPLSTMDMPSPGPGAFDPKYHFVQKKYPEYSMGEGISFRKKRKGVPAPNKYNMTQSMVWGKCKTITIKGRYPSKTRYLGPGPAAHVKLQTSLGGPKHTMRALPKFGLIHGFVSSIASVPDPSVPGPCYFPCHDEWLQKPQTFGLKPEVKNRGKHPAPNRYRPKVEPTGPQYGLRGRLKNREPDLTPGPSDYKVKRTMPEIKGITLGIKHAVIKDKNPTPGPDAYNRDRKSLTDPGYTLKYRWFDRAEEIYPGPGHYKMKKDPTVKDSPAYTIKPPWPDLCPNKEFPGPGHYEVSAPRLDKGRSIGLRLQPDMPA